MAVKAPGTPLSFSEIQAEFGGTNPISMSEYIRGGAFVPDGPAVNSGISNTENSVRFGAFYSSVRAFVFNQTISSNTTNYNLRTAAIAAGWDQVIPLLAEVTVNSGVIIGSNSAGTPGFDVGLTTVPDGSSIKVNNSGTINGRGGVGGVGGTNNGNGATGGTGGAAFKTLVATTLNNLGAIRSGSGGQGGGAAVRNGGTSGFQGISCSGGIGCPARSCSIGFCNTNVGPTGATGGATGATGVSGSGGSNAFYGTAENCASGASCTGPSCNRIASCLTGSPGAGGAPGPSIVGNANITYINTGTRSGPIT